ncbi:glycosyltransferase family 2 protein [Shimia sp. R9_2]|uniref:glycosyltransferase family 2 protein n=1 Tax=Shimia sp. R9_2 TaxID=2821112 RepID=UPI001ADC3273|nr:glycosyltransferase family 2 protein [Shimia sp. R9_2]MBO9395693.1 glycosyltransferase family 2 protein [Shimia sp. R9_2]
MAILDFGSDSAAPKVTVVTTMKDEGPYILDWVAHYKALGATDIVVFTNDCSDPTDQILRNLNRLGYVHHRFNRVMRRGPHKSALMWAEQEPVVRDADWLLVVDVDEYLDIKVGDGTFKALIDHHKGADAISLVWRIFGNAGIEHISDRPVPEEFVKCEGAEVNPQRRSRFFKTLFRNNEKFNRMGVHRPFLERRASDIVWVTADGTRIPDENMPGALHVSDGYGYEVAQLNHYALRSKDAFLNKQRRGRANHVGGNLKLAYWKKFDRNEVEDHSLAEGFAKALPIKEAMLDDPVVRRRHEEAIEGARAMAKMARRKRPGRAFVVHLDRMLSGGHMPDEEEIELSSDGTDQAA